MFTGLFLGLVGGGLAVCLLCQDDAGLLAYARAMLWWRARHRYCAACGAPVRSSGTRPASSPES